MNVKDQLLSAGRVGSFGALLLACQAASAQFETGFEAPTYTGSPFGVILNGQDTFYKPVLGSDTFLVYEYAGNSLGLPQNPGGGDQFAAGTGPGPVKPPLVPFARSQRDTPYGDGTGVWTVSFDIAALFTGDLPSAQNIGSFSTQLFDEEATYISLARWTDPLTAATWNADYVWFDLFGGQLLEEVPNPGFQNLSTSHWYRWSTTFDLDANTITEVSLEDLTTGVTATYNPEGDLARYLVGGAFAPGPPTGFRLFAGSNTVAGNTLAFDNVSIVIPGPAALSLLAVAGLISRRRRR